MKASTILFILSTLVSAVCGQETMTVKRFKELAAAAGDSKPLRAELAIGPWWAKSKITETMKFEDGRIVREELDLTRKSIEGEYIVVSFYSPFYKQTMHSIVGYDSKALALRQWGVNGDTLISATVVCDAKKKVSAGTSTYAGGFLELGVTSFSNEEITFRIEVFKEGSRFLVREGREYPVGKGGSAEPAGAGQPATQPADKEPPKDQPQTPTSKDAPR